MQSWSRSSRLLLALQKVVAFVLLVLGRGGAPKVIRETGSQRFDSALGSRVNGTNERTKGNMEKWEKEVKPDTHRDHLLMSDSEHVSTL